MDVDAVEDDNDDDDDEHADGDGEERALQGRFVSGSFALTHMATDDVVAAGAKEVHDAKMRKAAAAAAKRHKEDQDGAGSHEAESQPPTQLVNG